ncbi:MAG: hypothetical protein JNM38_24720 [Acidobacteria bacterium]|nr:hypothetical protein [Acidobacteriota bacterium]
MTDDVVQVAERLDRIEAALSALDARLGALERTTAAWVTTPAQAPPVVDAAAPPALGAGDLAPTAFESGLVLPLLGRTFIVFGGAFLLRALTDAGRLPHAAGIVLGLLYACALIGASGRAAGRGQRLSAAFHALAASTIGLPVAWEATTRFAFVTPPMAMGLVGAFVAIALAVAWVHRIQSLAGFATVGGVVTIAGLVMVVGGIAAGTLVLILMGFATLWLGYDRDWHWMRWPAAIVANLAVIEIATRAVRPGRPEAPAVAIALQLLLLGGYLAMIALRTLVKGRLVIPFEVVQTVAVLAVGLGGAVSVAQRVGTGELALGAVALALGAGCYGAAFAFVDRHQGLGENFYFYATLALVLTLTGASVVLAPHALAVALSGLAVLAAVMANRFARVALVLHCAVYVTMAAGISGLFAAAVVAFTGTPVEGWPSLASPAWIALVAAGASLAVAAPARDALLTKVPRVVVALVVVSGCGTAVVLVMAPLFAGMPAAPGPLAMLRAVVLAAAAVVLALATRHERGADLGRLLYPALVVFAVKLVAEDVRLAEAGTLVVSLGLFGIALLAAPRLARRTPAVT